MLLSSAGKGNYGFELSNDYLEVLETLFWRLRLELGKWGYKINLIIYKGGHEISSVDMQEKHRYQMFLEGQNLHIIRVRKAKQRQEPLTNTGGLHLNEAIKKLQVCERSSEKSENVRSGSDLLFLYCM